MVASWRRHHWQQVMCRRCRELEEQERELLRNQGSMQEALAQLGARAEAAEQKLQTRVQELQAEHEELAALLRTNAAASLEVGLPRAYAFVLTDQHICSVDQLVSCDNSLQISSTRNTQQIVNILHWLDRLT